MSERMKLVIDRSRWLRGEGSKASRLLRDGDRKMCCLGFYGIAKGASEVDLFEARAPAVVPDACAWNGLLSDGLASDSCGYLMMVNDTAEITEAERELRLTRKFADLGVDVEFVDAAAHGSGGGDA